MKKNTSILLLFAAFQLSSFPAFQLSGVMRSEAAATGDGELLAFIETALLFQAVQDVCVISTVPTALYGLVHAVPLVSPVAIIAEMGIDGSTRNSKVYSAIKSEKREGRVVQIFSGLIAGDLISVGTDLICTLGDCLIKGIQNLMDYLKDGNLDYNHFQDMAPFMVSTRAHFDDIADVLNAYAIGEDTACAKLANQCLDSLKNFVGIK